MDKHDILSMNILELESLLTSMDEQKFRAEQVFQWIHERGVLDYNDMTNLSKDLRHKLEEEYPLKAPKILEKHESKIDGTIKYLIELEDNNVIESVLMRYNHGNSVCISSQVGCKMGCTFCASTVGGLVRNLTPGEMVSQIYLIQNDINERVASVVVMGIGEPLEKLDTTIRFVELINSEQGQNIGQRHITVSTCGLVPQIHELASKELQITLAVSLHASDDNLRKEIMPIANMHSIKDLIEACTVYTKKTGRRITFEYAMIDGMNDTRKDAYELGKLLKGMLCHVNLISINKIDEVEYVNSDKGSIKEFAKILTDFGVQTTVRRTLGADIDAACGQLRRRFIQNRGD